MSKIKVLLMRVWRAQLKHLIAYRSGHQTLGCKITHMIGIPMIMASTLAFILYAITPLRIILFITLGAFTQPTFNAFMFCFRVALPNILQDVLVMDSALTNLKAGIALAVIGWIFQFIGHKFYEKNSPLFLSNPFNPLSYTTAVIFIAGEFGQLILRPFKRNRR